MMHAKKAYDQMRQEIISALEKFERESGMVVNDIRIDRSDFTQLGDAATKIRRVLRIEIKNRDEGWL